jgi:hypothetical protein
VILGINVATGVEKIKKSNAESMLNYPMRTFGALAITSLLFHGISGLLFNRVMIWLFPSVFQGDISVLFVNFTQWITPSPNVAIGLAQKYGMGSFDASFNLCMMYLVFPFTSVINVTGFFWFNT